MVVHMDDVVRELGCCLQLVLFHLREMEKLAAPGRALELISDEWVVRLLTFLLRQKCVIEVARLLYVLLCDDRGLPPEAGLLDGDGLSLHTRWLSAFYAGQHYGRRTKGAAFCTPLF